MVRLQAFVLPSLPCPLAAFSSRPSRPSAQRCPGPVLYGVEEVALLLLIVFATSFASAG